MPEAPANDQIFIRKLIQLVLANMTNENFGISELARESGISRYRLSRKLKEIGGKTVIQFIREVRLQKAMEMIRTEDLTISEIAYRTGFNSPTYFNTCFSEFFGYPPGKVKDLTQEKGGPETGGRDADAKGQIGSGRKKKFLSIPVMLVLAFVTVLVVNAPYNKFHVPDWTDDLKSPDGRISIAIMPFNNMTHDTLWNMWQEGIQENLISALSNNKELKIRNKESVNALLQAGGFTNYSALSPAIAGRISQKLDAGIFVSGSVQQAGSVLRIDAVLTDAKTKEVIKSFISELPFQERNVFRSVDSLSQAIKNFLLISKIRKDNPVYQRYALPSTNSPEAFRYFIYGNQAAARFENDRAISWYNLALEADSNYFEPMMGLSSVYSRVGNMEKDYEWVFRYYKKIEHFSFEDQLWARWAYATNFEPPEEAIKYLRQIRQLDDQSPVSYYLIGVTYTSVKEYYKAIPELEKNLEICRKWGKDFMNNNSMYTELGLAYHYTGQFRKEKKLYKLGEKYMPDDGPLTCRQAILAFTQKDTASANRYLEKFISLHKTRYGSSQAHIDRRIAELYQGAGMLDKAEEYFRKSLSLEPDNPERMFILADFFIETNRNPGEVPGLIDKALALASNKMDYNKYLDLKGWGLYKQGKNKEALEVLEKTWNGVPFPLYSIRSHLETVRKACGIKQPS
jgi:AraC-like DNA-binding protein/tetratricopeptide (TPR) repeat protein